MLCMYMRFYDSTLIYSTSKDKHGDSDLDNFLIFFKINGV